MSKKFFSGGIANHFKEKYKSTNITLKLKPKLLWCKNNTFIFM